MPEKNLHRKRLSLLHVLGTILALVLLVVLFSQQGWGEIGLAIQAIPAWRIGLALGLTLISRFAVVGRWHVLLRSAGLKISAWQSAQITFAGLFASQFLPTTVGGDVIRLAGALRLGLDKAVCLASLIVDRLVGMAGMAMSALGLFFFLPGLLGRLRLGWPFPWLPGTMVSPFVHPVVTGFGQPNASKARHVWAWGNQVIRRLGQSLLLWLKHPRALLLSLGFTWVHMLCVFGSIAIFLPALEEKMPFWLIGGLWSLTYFVTLLPVSVNGIGVQELSVTLFFSELGGLNMANALTIALLVRLLPMFASLPGSLAIPALMAGHSKGENIIE